MDCFELFVSGPIVLIGAHVGGTLVLTGATLDEGLLADGLRVDQDMFCRKKFKSNGEVRLLGARIRGQLSFEDATLEAGLNADGLQVDQDMFCQGGFTAGGPVRLVGGHIGGQLSMADATFNGELNAYGLKVDQSMICGERFTAADEVRLSGVHIGGELVLNGAELKKGLQADRLEVDQDVICGKGFAAGGQVSLLGANVGGQLSFRDGTLGSESLALDLEEARVGTNVILDFRQRPSGVVDLTGAHFGGLIDSEHTWPARLIVRGSSYSKVLATEDGSEEGFGARLRHRGAADMRRRLRWIALGERSTGYTPQPYTQLMSVYRREGRDGDARRVAYERERRRRTQLGPLGKAWNLFLRATVGYGYRPLRTLGLLAVLVFGGALVFSSFHHNGHLSSKSSDHPPFVASIYTLDRMIPADVVSFGLRDSFTPTGAAQWWAFAYTLVGWILTIAVVAGITAVVRRE
jgi:hypothetical protein